MPASNPIVNGMHVSSIAQAGETPPAIEAATAPRPTEPKFKVPFVVVLAFALLVLLWMTHVAGFSLIAAARVG
jgi:hypothetical protein